MTDRVQIGEEEEAFLPFLQLVLHPHPIADRAKIIAEVEIAGRLDAGDDTHGSSDSVSLERVSVWRRISALNSCLVEHAQDDGSERERDERRPA